MLRVLLLTNQTCLPPHLVQCYRLEKEEQSFLFYFFQLETKFNSADITLRIKVVISKLNQFAQPVRVFREAVSLCVFLPVTYLC